MEKLKFAVVGLGRIGKIHLENLIQMKEIEVVAVMDTMEAPRVYAQDKRIPFITSSFNNLLTCTPFDVVVICSPTNTHADFVELAAKAGKHIFCEKPLDLSLDRVISVLDIVKEFNVKLMLGFNRRFDKEFKSIKKQVKEGKIGNVHLIKITSRDPSTPPLDYIKKSGGLFLDMTIHDFDIARFVVDKEIEEVYAKGAVLIDSAIGELGDIDTAVITLTYTDGTLAVIDNSRQASYGYDQRIEVFGSKGMIQANNNFHDSHTLYNSEGVHSSLLLNFFLDRYAEAYKLEIIDYVNCLVNRKKIPVSGEDGLQSLKIGLAAKKSLKLNRPVKISEIN